MPCRKSRKMSVWMRQFDLASHRRREQEKTAVCATPGTKLRKARRGGRAVFVNEGAGECWRACLCQYLGAHGKADYSPSRSGSVNAALRSGRREASLGARRTRGTFHRFTSFFSDLIPVYMIEPVCGPTTACLRKQLPGVALSGWTDDPGNSFRIGSQDFTDRFLGLRGRRLAFRQRMGLSWHPACM